MAKATTQPAKSRDESLAATIRKVVKKREKRALVLGSRLNLDQPHAQLVRGMEMIRAVKERRQAPQFQKDVRERFLKSFAEDEDFSRQSPQFRKELKELGLRTLRRLASEREGKFLMRSVKAGQEAKRLKAAAKLRKAQDVRAEALLPEERRKVAARTKLLRARSRARREKE